MLPLVKVERVKVVLKDELSCPVLAPLPVELARGDGGGVRVHPLAVGRGQGDACQDQCA